MPGKASVLVLIVTPHWLGIETPDGQRGWLPEEEMEPLP
jgi:predicted cobalt transporter CbtA